jgi:hypothetical protein
MVKGLSCYWQRMKIEIPTYHRSKTVKTQNVNGNRLVVVFHSEGK